MLHAAHSGASVVHLLHQSGPQLGLLGSGFSQSASHCEVHLRLGGAAAAAASAFALAAAAAKRPPGACGNVGPLAASCPPPPETQLVCVHGLPEGHPRRAVLGVYVRVPEEVRRRRVALLPRSPYISLHISPHISLPMSRYISPRWGGAA